MAAVTGVAHIGHACAMQEAEQFFGKLPFMLWAIRVFGDTR
jgi:hypothetical protein